MKELARSSQDEARPKKVIENNEDVISDCDTVLNSLKVQWDSSAEGIMNLFVSFMQTLDLLTNMG